MPSIYFPSPPKYTNLEIFVTKSPDKMEISNTNSPQAVTLRGVAEIARYVLEQDRDEVIRILDFYGLKNVGKEDDKVKLVSVALVVGVIKNSKLKKP